MDQLDEMPTDWERALAIVAHPDDLEYGAAAAIAAWTDAGKTVAYLLVSRGEAGIDSIPPDECGPLRELEQIAAAALVGVEVVEFLDYADGRIEPSIDLRRDLAAAIRRHRPELVITINPHDVWGPGSWNMADHRNVGRAVLDATADAANRWVFPDLAEHGLEAWSGTRWVAVAGSPNPTHAADITTGLDRAIASLEAHARYLEGLGDHPMADARAFLTNMANAMASRFGGRQAATFELIAR